MKPAWKRNYRTKHVQNKITENYKSYRNANIIVYTVTGQLRHDAPGTDRLDASLLILEKTKTRSAHFPPFPYDLLFHSPQLDPFSPVIASACSESVKGLSRWSKVRQVQRPPYLIFSEVRRFLSG